VARASREVSSFTEAVCRLFDDSGLARALERNEVVCGVRVDAVLRRLGKAIQVITSLKTLLISSQIQ